MFKEFFLFELKHRLKQPMVYIFFLINFILVFAATCSDNVTIGGSGGATNVNSPHTIMSMTLIMLLLGVFMVTAFINTAILRDANSKYEGILYAAPINKFGYLGGRFLGAYLIALVPALGLFAGIAIGSMTGWVTESQTGPFMLSAYLNTFFMMVIPNTLLVAAIVFMLAALFRSSIISFLGSIGIVVIYMIMISFAGDLDNEFMTILCDPLGINSHDIITKYWTVDEKNTQLLPWSGPMLLNRILWFGLSILLLAFTVYRFSFTKRNSRKQKNTTTPAKTAFNPVLTSLKPLPKVTVYNNTSTHITQFFHQTKMEFWGIVKSIPFLILLTMGVLNMSGSVLNANEMFGTGNYPVTYLVVNAIRGGLYLFVVIVITYYTGIIIWRERDAKMNEFFDASPFPDWIPYLSKLVALIGITALLLIVGILFGMLSQVYNGYTQFEMGVYFREFLVYDLLSFTGIIVLALLIQVVVNNKYLGFFAFLVAMIALAFGPGALKIKSNLLSFNSIPNYVYSDMNGWSVFEAGLTWFHTYWLLFAGFLAVLSITLWVRGKLTFRQRLQIARQRFSGRLVWLTLGLGVLWIGTGSFLFYQTKIVNEVKGSTAEELKEKEYELNYKQYEHLTQPRITDIDYTIDIFPNERDFKVGAKVQAKNKSKAAIKQLHFSIPPDVDVAIDVPGAKLDMEDERLRYRIYSFDQPLEAGASFTYTVQSDYTTTGIENEIQNTNIVENGTFLASYQIMPSIGYNNEYELTDKDKREEHGLAYRPRAAKLEAGCSHTCSSPYISTDSDWVNVASTISTVPDQIAIAPGTLLKEWQENNRRYFRYELKKPVLNFYSFISARYEVVREEWTAPTGEKVDIEIYHHKGHEYNVDKMVTAVKNTLDYCTKHFSPYPHEQARIVEFPRYASFAQAFPGTMPYSEGIGFIANLNEKDAIDMVTYIVAHEMAHQWWAHQVVGSNMQGATMLSESFSQYAALMVMKATYGKDKMKQFLKYEMDRYLRARGHEEEKELPLMYVEDQSYIHYQKGSVVMYALQDYIGENRLNDALKRYAEAVSYQEAPYTNSLEVMEYIEEVTPDSLQYLLKDMFRTITLYSNKTTTATYRKTAEGQYEVTIGVHIEKYRADSLGKETLIPHSDFIDIGIFSKDKAENEKYGKPILVERHQISTTDTSFTFIVGELPYEAGIDPDYLLVDRFPMDNIKKLELEGE